MKCPICTSENLVLSERQGIEIDYCPQCRGVWLDRGELDKIIERSYSQTSSAQPMTAQPDQHDPRMHKGESDHHRDHDSHHGGHYRRKSWLGELFD